MNNINFLQTIGFPFDLNTLDFMQKSYGIFNALGELAGNYAIISGCTTTGSTVSDGVVYIDGEIFTFKGGTASSTVIIKQDITSLEFEDGNSNEVEYTRYVTFGVGSAAIPWASFKRITNLLTMAEQILALQGRILPPKTNPQLYCGSVSAIPIGWQLCDGTNGTPDLRSRFVVGYNLNDSDYNAIGKTGGSKQVTPTGTLESVSVSLTIPRTGWGTQGTKPSPSVSIQAGQLVVGSGNPELGEDLESLRASGLDRSLTGGSHSHSFSGTAHENRPPYYTLAYIIYVGN